MKNFYFLIIIGFLLNSPASALYRSNGNACADSEQKIVICAVDTQIGIISHPRDPIFGWLNCQTPVANDSNVVEVCIQNKNSECVYKMNRVSSNIWKGDGAKYLDLNGAWQECSLAGGYCLGANQKCLYTDPKNNAVLCSYRNTDPLLYFTGCNQVGICNDGKGIEDFPCSFDKVAGDFDAGANSFKQNASCYKKYLYSGKSSDAPFSWHNYNTENCPVYVCQQGSEQDGAWVYKGKITFLGKTTGQVVDASIDCGYKCKKKLKSLGTIILTTEQNCIIGG